MTRHVDFASFTSFMVGDGAWVAGHDVGDQPQEVEFPEAAKDTFGRCQKGSDSTEVKVPTLPLSGKARATSCQIKLMQRIGGA